MQPETLQEPLRQAFRVGSLGVGWDPEAQRITVEATSMPDDGADPVDLVEARPAGEPDELDLMRVRVTTAQVRGFVGQAARLVAAGRPTCPFCGEVIGPSGHFCTRTNGQLN
jgi:uncharacterized repeat protein (TIGR03847 family)